MQLYVLDRANNTIATTSDFYNENLVQTLGSGTSFQFTISKSDEAAPFVDTGSRIVFQDDRGRAWSFDVLNYDENQLTKTFYTYDAGMSLNNKAVDTWTNMGNHTFEYYFDLITKDTPWVLGINQLSELSRTLEYDGRDTGLSRLFSILTGFDNAECKFNVKIKQNQPVEFVVDVYKQIGTVQENIQIVHDVELNDIKKTESRAAFVTAIQGVGGTIEQESDGTTVTTAAEEQHVDFTDLEYDDGDYFTTKGDPFLRARTANKKFNPNQENSYIEDFYDYDTQDPQELLNRTLTQLKTYSEPQYTYDADVQVIDPTLEIGDTVTIIDHDYNPALYLSARVATLEKCYSDPTQNKITFTNYQILNSKIDDKIRAMQNIINAMPSSSSIQAITSNLANIKNTIDDLTVKLAGANGKNSNYYGPDEPTDAQQGDTWFQDAGDGKTIIKQFVDGGWKTILDTSLTDYINTQLEDAKKDIAAAQKTADDAVAQTQSAVLEFNKQINTVTQSINDNAGKLVTLTTSFDGYQTSVTNSIEGLTTQQTTLAGQYTSVAKSVDGLTSELTQTVSDMNLRVQKNDIINQINLSTESILISGNKVHITGQTTIDNGLITNAMIKDGSINNAKIVDATIASAKIANLDGSKIVANSITADKLAVNAIQVGMGNYLSTIKLSPDDINFYVAGKSYSSLRLNGNGMYVNDVHNGEQAAWITADSWIAGNTNYNGLQINLYDNADTFSINKINDKTAGAAMSSILFWSRSAQKNNGIELGFNFYDYVTFNKPLVILDKIYDKWSGVSFRVTNYNSAGVALINDAGAGVCFGNDGHLYFLNKNKYVDSVKALNITGV